MNSMRSHLCSPSTMTPRLHENPLELLRCAALRFASLRERTSTCAGDDHCLVLFSYPRSARGGLPAAPHSCT
jgi:hypothetical protein